MTDHGDERKKPAEEEDIGSEDSDSDDNGEGGDDGSG